MNGGSRNGLGISIHDKTQWARDKEDCDLIDHPAGGPTLREHGLLAGEHVTRIEYRAHGAALAAVDPKKRAVVFVLRLPSALTTVGGSGTSAIRITGDPSSARHRGFIAGGA